MDECKQCGSRGRGILCDGCQEEEPRSVDVKEQNEKYMGLPGFRKRKFKFEGKAGKKSWNS